MIRSVLAGLMGHSIKELKQEIEELEESLNDMHNLTVKGFSLYEVEETTIKSMLTDAAINILDRDLRI